MRNVFKSVVTTIMVMFSICSLANSVAWDSEHADSAWLNQESEHFSITYHQEQQKSADKILRIAEQVHQELVPFFQYSPELKTEIVIVDDTDYSNGFATPVPYPQIRVMLQPPSELNDLAVIGEWLPSLIRHEYTHVLHMEMSQGYVSGARKIFGRLPVLFPHAFIPPMFLEGLAVYKETDVKHGYGRLHSSLYDMVMRMEVAEDAVKDFSEVIVNSRQLPKGLHYYYGSYFIDYLAHTYGEDKMQQFLQVESSTVFPNVNLNTNASLVFGKSFHELWDDFKLDLKNTYTKQINKIKRDSINGKTKELLYMPFKQVMTSSQNGLIVNKSDGKSTPQLVVLKNKTASKEIETTKLTDHRGIVSFDHKPQHGLIVSRLTRYISGVDYTDLYHYHNNTWQQLTTKQRFSKARWYHHSDNVLASRNINGQSELWQVSVNTNQSDKANKQLLWRGTDQETLGDYTISQDDQYLIAAVKRDHANWNLEKFNLQTRVWQKVTDNKNIQFNPSFLPNGDIVFSADYDHVFNIYSINLDTKKIKQLTHELGGAFNPLWQDGLGLVYQAYHHDGYKTKVIAAPKAIKQISTKQLQAVYDYPQVGLKAVKTSKAVNYSPYKTLKPTSVIPSISFDNFGYNYGVTLNGQDALMRHSYSLNLLYNPVFSLPSYSFVYGYDNRWTFHSSRSYDFNFTSNLPLSWGPRLASEDGIVARDSVNIVRSNLLPLFEDRLSFSLGTSWNRRASIPQANIEARNEGLFGVAAVLDTRQSVLNLPGKGVGTSANIVAEYNKGVESTKNGFSAHSALTQTWGLPYYSTLSVGVAGGYTDPNITGYNIVGTYHSPDLRLFGKRTIKQLGYYELFNTGHKFVQSDLAVRSLLYRLDRSNLFWGVGVGDIESKAFVSSANVWDNKFSTENSLSSAGLELNTEVILNYNARIKVGTGYAAGLARGYGLYYLSFDENF